MNYTFSKNFLIGTELVKRKFITQDQLDEALIYQQRKRSMRLGEALMELGYLSQEDLDKVIADQLGIPYIADFETLIVTEELLSKVPKELVKSYGVFPVAFDDTSVTVCAADPLDKRTQEALSKHCDIDVKFAIGGKEAIHAAINKHYRFD